MWLAHITWNYWPPTDSPARRSFVFMLNRYVWHTISAYMYGKTTGLSSKPARWTCDNCQRMSDFLSDVNLIMLIRMGNITDRLVSSCARSHLTSAYMKCVYGWASVLYVIIKFSRMDSLPNFITHGAPLRALRARELRWNTIHQLLAYFIFLHRT